MKGHKPRKRPVDDGFTRKAEFTYRQDGVSLEQMLRNGFEEVLPLILKEWEEQKALIVPPRPFRAFVEAHTSNGYTIAIEINGTPPSLEQVVELLRKRAENAENN